MWWCHHTCIGWLHRGANLAIAFGIKYINYGFNHSDLSLNLDFFKIIFKIKNYNMHNIVSLIHPSVHGSSMGMHKNTCLCLWMLESFDVINVNCKLIHRLAEHDRLWSNTEVGAKLTWMNYELTRLIKYTNS